MLEIDSAESTWDYWAGTSLGLPFQPPCPTLLACTSRDGRHSDTGLLLAVLGSSMWMVILTASRGAVLGILLSLVLSW